MDFNEYHWDNIDDGKLFPAHAQKQACSKEEKKEEKSIPDNFCIRVLEDAFAYEI